MFWADHLGVLEGESKVHTESWVNSLCNSVGIYTLK